MGLWGYFGCIEWWEWICDVAAASSWSLHSAATARLFVALFRHNKQHNDFFVLLDTQQIAGGSDYQFNATKMAQK